MAYDLCSRSYPGYKAGEIVDFGSTAESTPASPCINPTQITIYTGQDWVKKCVKPCPLPASSPVPLLTASSLPVPMSSEEKIAIAVAVGLGILFLGRAFV